MNIKQWLVDFGKLILCGFIFAVGVMVGGMVVTSLRLPAPSMPEGIDPATAGAVLMLEGPLFALALAVIARRLTGRFLTRAFVLSLFAWIPYTVNTQLEAAIFTTMANGFWFSIVDFLVPSVLCGAAVAFLFPPDERGAGLIESFKSFFSQRTAAAWFWRLVVVAVAFMPIYYFFGLLVVPFTAEYYQQNMYGLTMPGLDQILVILFVRSVLFLIACLPVVILWRGSRSSLFFRLGLALFILVGLLYMLAAYWMPVSVRLPHSLEIFADEFVYAGALVMLLMPGRSTTRAALSNAEAPTGSVAWA
jgi:hypothetical protein